MSDFRPKVAHESKLAAFYVEGTETENKLPTD